MRALFFATLAAGLVALAAPSGAGPDNEGAGTRLITVSARSATTERITLALGKAAVVELDTDARDVLVADPATVDAVVRTPRRIFLLAQKIGQTNAFFFDGQGAPAPARRYPRREGRHRPRRASSMRRCPARTCTSRRSTTTSCFRARSPMRPGTRRAPGSGRAAFAGDPDESREHADSRRQRAGDAEGPRGRDAAHRSPSSSASISRPRRSRVPCRCRSQPMTSSVSSVAR